MFSRALFRKRDFSACSQAPSFDVTPSPGQPENRVSRARTDAHRFWGPPHTKAPTGQLDYTRRARVGPAKGHFFINGKGCSTNTGPQYNVINAFECISNPTTKNTSNLKLITSTTDRFKCVDRARHERQIGVFSDGRKTRNRISAYWFVFSSFSMVQNGHFLKRGCSHEGKKGCHTPRSRAAKVITFRVFTSKIKEVR